MTVRKTFGKCSGCGREGLIAVRYNQGEYEASAALLREPDALVSFGGDVYCCGDKCYDKYRGVS